MVFIKLIPDNHKSVTIPWCPLNLAEIYHVVTLPFGVMLKNIFLFNFLWKFWKWKSLHDYVQYELYRWTQNMIKSCQHFCCCCFTWNDNIYVVFMIWLLYWYIQHTSFQRGFILYLLAVFLLSLSLSLWLWLFGFVNGELLFKNTNKPKNTNYFIYYSGIFLFYFIDKRINKTVEL